MSLVSIYKISGPDGVYVGQTIQTLSARLSQHFYKAKVLVNYGKLYRAMNKHPRLAFTIQEIERVDEADAVCREKFWIAHFDSFNNGYNSSVGGLGPEGMSVSFAVRQIHSKTTKEKWRNPSWVQKRRDGLEKNSNYRKSQSIKGKLGAAAKISKQSWFQVVDKKTMQSIGRWQNAVICAQHIGVHSTTVQRCVKGKREHSRYIFIEEF